MTELSITVNFVDYDIAFAPKLHREAQETKNA